MLLNCGVGEDSWESLGLKGDPTSPFWRKSTLNIHWKDWGLRWISNTLATWCEELTHLKWPWCWERLRAGGEGDDRGWDGWMASPTQSTWVWVNSRSRWWTGKPGVLQSMGSHRVVHGWVTELNWTDRKLLTCHPQLYSVPQGEDCVTQYAKTQIIWSKLWFTEGLILAKGFSLLKPHPKPNLWARWRLL